MFIVTIIIFITLFYKINKDGRMDSISKRIILIYIALWGFVISASSLGLYGIFLPSLSLRIMLILHVIAFVLGYKRVRISREAVERFSLIDLHKKFYLLTNSKLFKITSIVLASYIVSLMVTFFYILAVVNLAEMRGDFYEGGMYGNLFDMINGPILSVFNIIALPVFAWMLFYRRNLITFVLVVYLFGYASLGGGRLGYVIIMLVLVFISLCIFLTPENKYKRIRQLGVAGAIMLVLIGLVTVLRLNVSTSGDEAAQDVIDTTTEQVYCYAVGPISALDYAIEKKYVDRIHGYKYGCLTLSAVEALLYTSLNKVGIKYEKALNKLVEIKQEEYIKISDSHNWNALYTSNLFYYLDFGYLGMVLFPFLFGILFRHLIKQMYITSSCSMLILISYVYTVVIMSFIDFRFTNLFPLILSLVLYCFGGKRKFKISTMHK